METNYKKIAVETSRFVLAFVFIFSGFVKAVDPLGGAYKIFDYFLAFEFSDSDASALPLSFLQAAVEFGVGACLLIGIYRQINSILILLIMLFMTPLTLYIALTNPVSDCGCFGDALVISNWHTFIKNIFLLIASIIVFLWYRLMSPCFTRKGYFYPAIWIYVFITGLSLYCFYYLPVMDFRPYKIGINIPEKMEIPENAQRPVTDTKLIYEKDGIQKEFTVNNYPKDDASWKFVDSRTRIIKKGYQPPIRDFSITDTDGRDITDIILQSPSYTFLLVAHELNKANDSNVDKVNDIYDFSKARKYDFYALTSSSHAEIQEWIENTGAEYPFCMADNKTLKTIVRSNPGLLLIKGGTIVNMWPNTRLPDTEKLNKLIEETDRGKMLKINDFKTVFFLTLLFFTPLIGLFLFDFLSYRKIMAKFKNI